MPNFIRTSLIVLTVAASPAFASAKGGTPQNHHCMKDGAEEAGKTKKECKKDGGKWEKMPADAAKEGDSAPKTTP